MRNNRRQSTRFLWWAGLLGMMSVFALGCPEVPGPGGGGSPLPGGNTIDYELGFNTGFARDDWYWKGYDDGYDTMNFSPIYYEGDLIPYLDEVSFDAGFWDGVWWAYNDGYFVNYRYAFILGFSEGYDNAFWPDYLDFLAGDVHVEYLNGGWIDGYNDGFSEGRIFGASDYEQGLPFDWEDALLDYEAGVDLYFAEVDLGTGVYGPVYLYEYGTNPHTLKSQNRRENRLGGPARSIRPGLNKNTPVDDRELYRTFQQDARQRYERVPDTSTRSDRELRLDTSWMQRIESYIFGAKLAENRRERARQVSTD